MSKAILRSAAFALLALVSGTAAAQVDLAPFLKPGRNTVAAERRGNWTIEVRDAGGALLHEERFLVQ